MSTNELDLLRQRLEEQFRADVQLLYDGYCAKLRAYEAVFLGQGRIDPAALPALSLGAPPVPGLFQLSSSPAPAAALPAAAPPAPAAPAVPATPSVLKPAAKPLERPREGPNELKDAVLAALASLGEVFDKNDVARVLGYAPKRSTLNRILSSLSVKGRGPLEVERMGGGRTTTRYRRMSPAASDPAPETLG